MHVFVSNPDASITTINQCGYSLLPSRASHDRPRASGLDPIPSIKKGLSGKCTSEFLRGVER